MRSWLIYCLAEQTEFTEEEWAAFGIRTLRREHFIRSGDRWFTPVFASGLKWVWRGQFDPRWGRIQGGIELTNPVLAPKQSTRRPAALPRR